MKRSTATALFGIVLLAAILRLLPLLRTVYWGSDFGEYYALTRALAQGGALPSAYAGWGMTYSYFPGLFVVNAAAVLAGASPDAAVVFLVPILASLAVLPMFLLAVRVTGDDLAGIVAAAFLAVVMLHVYPTSHAIPASVGDVLLLGALVMFLGLRTSPKLFGPLVLTGLAIVVTHHLATYALILAAASALLFRAVLDRKLALRTIRFELAFLAILVAATLAFWSLYAVPFWTLVIEHSPASPFLLIAGGVLAVVSTPLVIGLRRRISWRFRPRARSIRSAGLAAGLAFAASVVIVGAATMVPVAGTSIRVPAQAVVMFLPLFAFVALAGGGRKALDFSRGGAEITAWFLALILSIVAGALAAPGVLIPYRHLEYVAIPLAVMVGAGFRWLTLGLDGGRKGAAITAALVLLVAGTAASAYPPPAILAGWEEGIAPKTVEASLWVRAHAYGLVAGDHRESTALFGIGGTDATWDREIRFWHTTNLTAALDAMRAVPVTTGTSSVHWVMIDVDLRAGLQTTPFAPALPLLPAEEAKFMTTPFMKTYDNGFAQVYYVNWGLAP